MVTISQSLFRNRKFIMGVACLWIMFLHCHFETDFYPLFALERFGFTQVDVFMFLSGMGLYLSLSKQSNSWIFYQKRMARVIPAYLVFALIYVGYQFLCGEIEVYEALGVLTLTSYWQRGRHVFSWFGQAIILYYIIAPLFYRLISENREKKRRLAFMLLLTVIISVMFNRGNLVLAVSRLPSFFIGMLFAAFHNDETISASKIKAVGIVCSAISVILVACADLFLGDLVAKYIGEGYSIIFLPLFLLPLGECLVLADVADFLRRVSFTRILARFMEKLGEYTFEIYLAQTLLNIIFSPIISNFNSAVVGNLFRLALAVISLLLAVIVNRLVVVPIGRKCLA